MSAAAVAAVLALAVAGCGSDDGGKEPGNSGSSVTKTSGSDEKQQDTAAGESKDPNAKLAVLKGPTRWSTPSARWFATPVGSSRLRVR
ncbi:hypothetical protein NKH18_32730 [Streptomyces sp. M10(2022)]